MNILQEIKSLQDKKQTVRTNNEFNKIEKQILGLAKMYNEQNHRERFFIYNNNVYGLESNPNYLND
jgi:hypothetical protein